jgi:uncharacterized membrane protein
MLKALLSIGLLLIYSLSIHFGILSGQQLPALLVLAAVGTLLLLRRRRWWLLPLIPLTLYMIWSTDSVSALLLMPPVFINLLMALVFGSTLLPGATPLITQFSQLLKGNLDAKALKYTRRVTLAWVIFFALMALESALLALYAPPLVWSLFTNLLNYLFLLLFFLAEYILRVRLFPEQEHPGFIPFLRSLTKVDPRCIKTF